MLIGDKIITQHMVATLTTFMTFVGDGECSLPYDTKKAAWEHFAEAMCVLSAALAQDANTQQIIPEQAAAPVAAPVFPASIESPLHAPD